MLNFENPQLPAYANETYGWLYNNLDLSRFYDKKWFVNLRRFGQEQKLVDSLLREIELSQDVLQFGATFGSQMEETAGRVGCYSRYDIYDINIVQIGRCNQKFEERRNSLYAEQKDVREPIKDGLLYDVVVVYMLLHEVPVLSKSKIVNNALSKVVDGGKVVFVDYHQPVKWHPLRYVFRMFNRLYQPFVEKLWDRDIATYADVELRSQFTWSKSLFFGGMFQKVVAVKKLPFSHETSY